MWTRLQSGIRRLGSTWSDDDLANPGLSAPLIKVGNTWRVRLPYNTIGDNAAAGVINGGTLTLATVTAGRLPVLGAFSISTSALGIIRLRYNGVTIASSTLAAGGVMSDVIEAGLVLPTTGGVFDILNSTGAATNLAGFVWFSEYLP